MHQAPSQAGACGFSTTVLRVIEGPKTDETRQRRIANAVAQLSGGRT